MTEYMNNIDDNETNDDNLLLSEPDSGMSDDALNTNAPDLSEPGEPISEASKINRDDEGLDGSEETGLTEEELDAIADTAIDVIKGILEYFKAPNYEIEEYEGEENELIFDVVGENLGMLIGRHGRTLEAIQLLVTAIVNRKIGYHYPVVVDVEGYINRRKQKLITLAKTSAARAIRSNRSVRLRPMSPYERRIVHMALKDDRRVRTESEGTDPNRQIVIHLA